MSDYRHTQKIGLDYEYDEDREMRTCSYAEERHEDGANPFGGHVAVEVVIVCTSANLRCR